MREKQFEISLLLQKNKELKEKVRVLNTLLDEKDDEINSAHIKVENHIRWLAEEQHKVKQLNETITELKAQHLEQINEKNDDLNMAHRMLKGMWTPPAEHSDQ